MATRVSTLSRRTSISTWPRGHPPSPSRRTSISTWPRLTRASTLLVTSNIHFGVATRVSTLLVTLNVHFQCGWEVPSLRRTPIFDVAGRVSTLFMTSNIHFRRGWEGFPLLFMSDHPFLCLYMYFCVLEFDIFILYFNFLEPLYVLIDDGRECRDYYLISAHPHPPRTVRRAVKLCRRREGNDLNVADARFAKSSRTGPRTKRILKSH